MVFVQVVREVYESFKTERGGSVEFRDIESAIARAAPLSGLAGLGGRPEVP